MQNKGPQKIFIEQMLKQNKIEYICEHKFLHNRKFRFDYAMPQINLAIEYEGIFSNKSRHTSVTGFSKDCEKYNLAAINGWRVLRYTAKNFTQIENDLKFFLQTNKFN